MDRTDLQQLSKDQLIELVLRLQRPDKNSRTSSRPPSTDKKEKRENSRPGGAKPGHEPHNRRLADRPDEFRDHAPSVCERCGVSFSSDDDRELIGEYDEIEIPPVNPYASGTGALRANVAIVALRRKLQRPRSRRQRLLDRASMRWRFITRASRRFPMSVYAACSAMLLV